jgi:DNA (cytosine-5)-methyltransferase 1
MENLAEPEAKVLSSIPWRMHEFFAGSGLVSYGLRGMFNPVWANDVSEKKADVYRANFGSQHFLLADIKSVSGASLPFAHLSWASFPCQDLSLAGSLAGIKGERSGLVWEWLRILGEMDMRPSILVVENVEGLLSSDGGRNYRQLHFALLELGYVSGAVLINASHFVPQSRPRVFVIAVEKGVRVPDTLRDSGPNWMHGRASAKLGKGLPGWIWWRTGEPQARTVKLQDVLDFSLPYDKDDVLRLLSPRHKERLESMDSVVATGYRRTRNGKQCLELRFDGLAGCLRTPEGGSSKQFLVVKNGIQTHARSLTSREAARLMGAPDSFVLPGKRNDGYKAMGDAVAAPVAEFVGQAFLSKLAEAAYGRPQCSIMAEIL